MRFETTGSPILARQNPALYKFIVLSLAVVGFLLIVAFIAQKISTWMRSEAYIESRKSMPTTKKNVNSISRKALLTDDETKLLWHICRTQQARNIIYLAKDPVALKGLFSNHYALMKENGEDAARMEHFFTLYYKISTMQVNSKKLKSTNGLKSGQECFFKDAKGQDWIFTLLKNTRNFIELETPKMLFTSVDRPSPLSKIQISARLSEDETYSFLTRVIRYEEKPDGTYTIAITPANVVKQIQRRRHRRLATEIKCRGQKIEPTVKKSASDAGYTPDEEDFETVILDLSAAGCSFTSFQDIPIGKYVKITFPFNEKEIRVVGLIAGKSEVIYRMTHRHHVKFTSISTEAKNSIQEYALGFSQNFMAKDDKEDSKHPN